jgi:two-component system, OmpR family, alkaline phosphatase synthesis response regulator PhoP
MQVLIVDDEVAIVELLAELLTDEGYEVHTAHDGRNALALLRNGLQPSVIITDVMMPGLDGWALYGAIREIPTFRATGVVLMSAGRARPSELPDPRATFIAKPFNVFDILDAITRVS